MNALDNLGNLQSIYASKYCRISPHRSYSTIITIVIVITIIIHNHVDARRHVNRICVATNIPLIESGTAGYLGQVQVIKRVSSFKVVTIIE